ncbi:MAG: DUF1287 domain-containing protein [Firmicutes bacterium]|nr:DUF1287 domain-containing protein [Bacillota bacterium]
MKIHNLVIPAFAIIILFSGFLSGCTSQGNAHTGKNGSGGGFSIFGIKPSPSPKIKLSARQQKLIEGARSRIGDVYDDSWYADGFPPAGRSACVDIVYFAYKNNNFDLQTKVNEDIKQNSGLYPAVGDYAINHRRCPNLIVWFSRFAKKLPLETDKKHIAQWKPGDVIFWSMQNDGVADHIGLVSDQFSPDGVPLVIHQAAPTCVEENAMNTWKIMGHFRL